MARLLVLVALLLVPVISALDLEAYCDSLHPAGADEGVYVCHPEQANAGIWCNRAAGVMYAKVTECAKGHFFSISKAACVGELLSDCAAPSKRQSRFASACDVASSPEDESLVRLVCHPNSASKFIACPPNVAWAIELVCAGNRTFSAAKKRCVESRLTDCALALNVTTGNDTDERNVTSTLDLDSGDDAADARPAAGFLMMPTNATTANETDSRGNSTDNRNDTQGNSMNNSGPNAIIGGDDTESSDGTNEVGHMRYCPDAAPTGPGCIPRPGGNPRPTLPQPGSWPAPQGPSGPQGPGRVGPLYPVHPTYPTHRPDPRRLGPGPNRRGPPAECRPRYLFHQEKSDWEGARAICEIEGGQLAVITSEREQGRIASRFGKLAEFWIGATDIEREGQFRWVNGQGMGFARWYRSQPSKSYPNNEHCVTFNYWGKDAKWGDRNCFDSRPFLCETMVCRPVRNRFPTGYAAHFKGPLRSPFTFPRNRNFPGPRGMAGYATRHWPKGRGFPYSSWNRVQTPINL